MDLSASRPDPNRQLEALLSSTLPRLVPRALRRAAIKQSRSTSMILFGVLFACVGGVFCWWFFPWGFWKDWELRGHAAAHASGKVIAVQALNLSEGGSKHFSGTPVYQYDFAFSPTQGGPEVQGACYSTGLLYRQDNAAVTVEYLPGNPLVARISRTRLSQTSLIGMIAGIFPCAGLVLAGFAGWQRRRVKWLLANSEAGRATVLSIGATGWRVMGQRVYRATLCRTGRQEPLVVSQRDPVVVSFLRQAQDSKQPVWILFDPAKPQRVLFPESLTR